MYIFEEIGEVAQGFGQRTELVLYYAACEEMRENESIDN